MAFFFPRLQAKACVSLASNPVRFDQENKSSPWRHSSPAGRTMAVRGSAVCVFGTELSPCSPLPSFAPSIGHASCRLMESVICGELRCLVADGGASAQLGMRCTRKWQLGKWSLAGKEAEVGKYQNTDALEVLLARKVASLSHWKMLFHAHSTHTCGGAKKRAWTD